MIKPIANEDLLKRSDNCICDKASENRNTKDQLKKAENKSYANGRLPSLRK